MRIWFACIALVFLAACSRTPEDEKAAALAELQEIEANIARRYSEKLTQERIAAIIKESEKIRQDSILTLEKNRETGIVQLDDTTIAVYQHFKQSESSSFRERTLLGRIDEWQVKRGLSNESVLTRTNVIDPSCTCFGSPDLIAIIIRFKEPLSKSKVEN